MYGFRTLSGDDPLLDQSPLVRALDFLDKKFDEHPKGIPLTKNRAFKRDLVAEAITEIQWPGWTEAEIFHGFMPIKVANECHFGHFWQLHKHLMDLKLLRHYKGKLLLNKAGRMLFADRFARFNRLVQFILLYDPHMAWWRQKTGLIGNWDIWLNVLDMETTYGASGKQLTETLYGAEDEPNEFDPRTNTLYIGVLEPLMYCGLLEESRDNGRKLVDCIYRKTELWSAYLQLDEKPPMLRLVH